MNITEVRKDACPVCGAKPTTPVGAVYGVFSCRDDGLRRCDACGFAYVEDPWTAYERIYDASYYEGNGADPLIDYRSEVQDPNTIRQYEWRGIRQMGHGHCSCG